MKVLLDTHTFLWFVLNDSKLSQQAKPVIEDRGNEVLISPASYWELAIKINSGGYKLNRSFEDFWRIGMLESDIGVLHIDISHAARLVSLPFHHRDPFDRLLTAQSLVEQIPIISADATLDAYGIQRIW